MFTSSKGRQREEIKMGAKRNVVANRIIARFFAESQFASATVFKCDYLFSLDHSSTLTDSLAEFVYSVL